MPILPETLCLVQILPLQTPVTDITAPSATLSFDGGWHHIEHWCRCIERQYYCIKWRVFHVVSRCFISVSWCFISVSWCFTSGSLCFMCVSQCFTSVSQCFTSVSQCFTSVSWCFTMFSESCNDQHWLLHYLQSPHRRLLDFQSLQPAGIGYKTPKVIPC